jgi:hypothetical protein
VACVYNSWGRGAARSDMGQEHAIEAHGIHNTVDLLLMMAYDQPGRHSTYQFAQQVEPNVAA